MMSLNQISDLSKKLKISDSVIAREYFQILFLNELYSKSFSDKIVFKGGTCIRLIYGGQRFSEDLDFTVNMDESKFVANIQTLFDHISNTYPVVIKSKRSIAGKSYLLTAKIEGLEADVYIRLDFSFRENVLEPTKNIIKTDYPIISSHYIFTLSKNEIIAEKIRALMTRNKLRDLYDLWILQELGGKFDADLVNRKLEYYGKRFEIDSFLKRLDSFKINDFVVDLRPFVPFSERDRLKQLFVFVVDYCKKSVVA